MDQFISFEDAVARLGEPDADLNALRAELATVLTAVTEGRYGYDPRGRCQGMTLWTDPNDPQKRVRLRNGILTCVDGAQYSTSLEDLWIDRTSHAESPVDISFGQLFPGRGKDFDYHAIQAGLEEIVGCPLSSSVKAGFDNFFHYVFRRQFKERDRQRLMVENIITYMQGWEVALGNSRVSMRTGTIEVVCYLFPKELRDAERARNQEA